MIDDERPAFSPADAAAMFAQVGQAAVSHPLQVGSPQYDRLARALQRFDAQATIGAIAGLLTEPDYQTASIRLEILLHLAVLHCEGHTRPRFPDLARWLQVVLAESPARHAEDPVEDVFISNVVTPAGNVRIFEGLWEASDATLQDLLECLTAAWVAPYADAVRSVTALLLVSDLVAERAGLERWTTTEHELPPFGTSGVPSRPSTSSRSGIACVGWFVTGSDTGRGAREGTKHPAPTEVEAGEELPESGRPDSNRRRPAWEATEPDANERPSAQINHLAPLLGRSARADVGSFVIGNVSAGHGDPGIYDFGRSPESRALPLGQCAVVRQGAPGTAGLMLPPGLPRFPIL
jgi:hypothetical protein